MKKLAVLASFAVAGSAFAMDTTMNLKGRFDYQNNEVKQAGATTTTGEYKPAFLRWTTGAKFNETTSLKLTLDLVKANSVTENVLSGFAREAYMTKSLGYGLTAMIGKQDVAGGGRENEWSTRDMYSSSLFNSEFRGQFTGLGLSYEAAGQTVTIQHLEGNTTQLTDKKIVGVAYSGSFMDGMIAPTLSYTKAGTDNSGKYEIYTAIGAQVNWQAVVFELDYLMLTQEAATDRELKSIVAHVRYNHDMWRPFFKYVKEDGEGSFNMGDGVNARETERSVMELGLEIVPNKDEDFRYHVVYSAAEKKNSTGAENKHEDTKIYAGVAFGMNILK